MANHNASGGHRIHHSVQNPRRRVAATFVGNNGSGHHRRRKLVGVGGGAQAARAMLLNAVHAVADDGMEVIQSRQKDCPIAGQAVSPNHHAMCC